jgi:hypothetical protein
MRLWLEGLPHLELGTRTLIAGQTLDLGTLTMARPGFVEVRATRADGSTPEDGDVSIWNEARENSERIGLIGDVFRSEPLAPGRYQLGGGTKMASTWIRSRSSAARRRRSRSPSRRERPFVPVAPRPSTAALTHQVGSPTRRPRSGLCWPKYTRALS